VPSWDHKTVGRPVPGRPDRAQLRHCQSRRQLSGSGDWSSRASTVLSSALVRTPSSVPGGSTTCWPLASSPLAQGGDQGVEAGRDRGAQDAPVLLDHTPLGAPAPALRWRYWDAGREPAVQLVVERIEAGDQVGQQPPGQLVGLVGAPRPMSLAVSQACGSAAAGYRRIGTPGPALSGPPRSPGDR